MSNNKTLWDVALEKRREVVNGSHSANGDNGQSGTATVIQETHVLVCGMKNSGKSSLIQKFLDRDEMPKPTTALDFCYARKAKQNNMAGVKDIANIYELGGGTSMTKLIDVVISKNNIRDLVVVLVVDLAKPNEIWDCQHTILAQIKQRLSAVFNEEKKNNVNLEKEMLKSAWQRVGAEHKDKNMISPLLVPFVVVGGNFDVYQDFSNAKKEVIAKTLRFLTHHHGGMLQFFSTKAEGLSSRGKALISHMAFKTPLSKTISLDISKPIIVPFGADSLEQIGAPPVSADRLSKSRGGSPYELWKGVFETVFQPESKEKSVKADPGKDKSFADESVDNARTQKDQELERYRKLSERKAKETLLNASVGNVARKAKTK